MVLPPLPANITELVKLPIVLSIFVIFTIIMWRYLENADWGRYNFLRENLSIRVVIGVIIAFSFWLLLSFLFLISNTWLLSNSIL